MAQRESAKLLQLLRDLLAAWALREIFSHARRNCEFNSM
jgi:hypothetical protein